MMNIVAYFSDKYHQRGLGVVFNALMCIIGLPIMGFAGTPAVRYFGVFLATAGCNGNVPLVLTYQANNIRGQWVSPQQTMEPTHIQVQSLTYCLSRNVPLLPLQSSVLEVSAVLSAPLSSERRTLHTTRPVFTPPSVPTASLSLLLPFSASSSLGTTRRPREARLRLRVLRRDSSTPCKIVLLYFVMLVC